MAEKKLKTLQFEGLNTTYVLPEVDPTSSIPGDAADAKIVGDHLTDINNPHGVTLEQLGASKTIVTDENQDGHIILKSYLSDSGSGNISTHISDRSNPHKVTAVQVGADISGAAKQALEDAKGYTDEVITNLIGGAPDTLNTLQELAEAMEANAEVVEVLEKAITGKADNSALTAHIDNKNNPHNVTIEQIGAAPAGYGLGSNPRFIENEHKLNTYNSSGFYYWGAGNTDTDKPFMAGEMLVIKRATEGYVNQIAFSSDTGTPKIKVRKQLEGVWSNWEDWSPSTFAPKGLITKVYSVYSNTEIDNAIKEAWNNMADNSTAMITISALQSGLNLSGGNWHITLYQTSYAYGSLMAIKYNGYGVDIMCRGLFNSVWGEWEWINPPMILGVEYRTTERWQGKPVYTKLLNFGTMPNATNKTVDAGIQYIDSPISITVTAISDTWCFVLPSSYTQETKVLFSKNIVEIETTVDRSNYTAYALLKYTKL